MVPLSYARSYYQAEVRRLLDHMVTMTGSTVEWEPQETLDQLLVAIVAAMRAGGATWREVGERFGMSRQAAHRRWSADVARQERVREYRMARQREAPAAEGGGGMVTG